MSNDVTFLLIAFFLVASQGYVLGTDDGALDDDRWLLRSTWFGLAAIGLAVVAGWLLRAAGW